MTRYHIRINIGDDNLTRMFYFTPNDELFAGKDASCSDAAFNDAVQEINRIYKTYGRFAEAKGVIKLFSSFGFDWSPR